MRHSSSAPNFSHVLPMPVVSLHSRHFVSDPVRTRLGVGEAFIDHAAGMQLRSRRPSTPPSAPTRSAYALDAPARGWEMSESAYDARALPARTFVNDDPIELPLRSRTTGYAVIAALIVAFMAVLISVALAGGRTSSSNAQSSSSNAQSEVAEPGK